MDGNYFQHIGYFSFFMCTRRLYDQEQNCTQFTKDKKKIEENNVSTGVKKART